jgi:hypothetical protein
MMPATPLADDPNGQPAEVLDEGERDEPVLSEPVLDETGLDERARKRLAVGLSPRRPTAKSAPLRPPDVQMLPLPPLALALLLVVVVLGTVLLLAGNLTGWTARWRPLWSPAGSAPVSQAPAPPLGSGYALRLHTDFGAVTPLLLQAERRQEWRTELLPAESVYRMQVWPSKLAWSLLGAQDLNAYRIQTSALVTAATPEGYAGLIVRYQDERHFYLFAVDGQGRYLVQLQNGDSSAPVIPWTAAPSLNLAGNANLLAVDDGAEGLRFAANGMVLAEIPAPVYGPGDVGLAGGSLARKVAELRFDWLQLYAATEN